MQRERCPGDGRGYNAELTGAGLKRLRAAWPTHLASVRRHVIDHLNDLDQPTVTAALQRFASGTAYAEARHHAASLGTDTARLTIVAFGHPVLFGDAHRALIARLSVIPEGTGPVKPSGRAGCDRLSCCSGRFSEGGAAAQPGR